MSKAKRTQTNNKLNELIYPFAQIHKLEHLDKREMERKDTVSRAIHSLRHTNTDPLKQLGTVVIEQRQVGTRETNTKPRILHYNEIGMD